MARLIQLLL